MKKTFAKRIIPCLDVKDGRVVKGTNFVGLRDAGSPTELAERYDKERADELVFLDITASHEERNTMVDVVSDCASKVFIPLTVGGGIRNLEDMHRMLNAGADKISVNTAAVKNPEIIREGALRFGSQCVVVAIDARRNGIDSWEVYVNGGRTPTGMDCVSWAKDVVGLGAGEILLTVQRMVMISHSRVLYRKMSTYPLSLPEVPANWSISMMSLPKEKRMPYWLRRCSTMENFP